MPLVLSVLGAIATALVVSTTLEGWAPPGPGFFLGVAACVLGALGICCLALPLMNVATGHDSVRYE